VALGILVLPWLKGLMRERHSPARLNLGINEDQPG